MFARFYKPLVTLLIVSLTGALLAVPVFAHSKGKPDNTSTTATTNAPQDASSAQPDVATKPEKAKGPLAESLVIQPHKPQWYKFHYHYDNNDNHSEPTEAMVKLTAQTGGCLIFEVWTAGGLQSTKGKTHKPVGVGSPMQDQSKVLLWVGGATATEDYYVVVKNKTDSACSYQLAISGPAVSY